MDMGKTVLGLSFQFQLLRLIEFVNNLNPFSRSVDNCILFLFDNAGQAIHSNRQKQ